MNRIEIVALFQALEILGEEKNYDGMMKLVRTVLREALIKPQVDRKEDREDN